MNIFKKIHPSKPLKYLRWFDIVIITIIMFGQFIIRSTELFLANTFPTGASSTVGAVRQAASESAAYFSNFTLQAILLTVTLLYLLIRNYDFKQLPICWNWSIIFWVPFIFALVGLFGDLVTTLTGKYNYFNPDLFAYIDFTQIIGKFLALSPIAIAYALLNGFYEEFFFLGLLTSVKEKHKWLVLLYSTSIRISFHTYQGLVWALVIGVVYGLFYYFLYKYKIKNLLPFFLMHALADMFGSSLIYLLVAWGT